MAEYDERFYRHLAETSALSAEELVPIVMEFVGPQSVVDVGCGVGSWLAAFHRHGIKDLLGVDGQWVEPGSLAIPPSRFRVVDLTRPLDLGRTFDLALSLEVGEHLPESSALYLVESLTKHAPVVLFSAAIPFQGGTSHKNEQWPEYWAALFDGFGFAPVDAIRRRAWRNERVQWWYAQNTLFYVRRDLLSNYPLLGQEHERTSMAQLSIVHPRKYIELAKPQPVTFRKLVSDGYSYFRSRFSRTRA